MLYALNGHYLKFVEALHHLNHDASLTQTWLRSPAHAYQQAVTAYKDHTPTPSAGSIPTFAELFRQPLAKEVET
jgi:hypothetical protein